MFRLGVLVNPGEGPTSLRPPLLLGAGVPAKLQAPAGKTQKSQLPREDIGSHNLSLLL